jgi:hypothetical protein
MGTVVDGDLHWKGGYDTNDGQFVLHEDGINFAGALEKGLSAIPEENKEEFKEVDKQIKELIVFSKKDGFSIY